MVSYIVMPLSNAERQALYRLRKKSGQNPKTNGGQGNKGKVPKPLDLEPSIPRVDFPPALMAIHSLSKGLGWEPETVLKMVEKTGILSQITRQNEPVHYSRFPGLYPWQIELINAIQDNTHKVVVIEGPRRGGKSNGCFTGIFESAFKTRKHWGMWGASQDSAQAILHDMVYDKTSTQMFNLLNHHIASEATYANGCEITVHATTIGDSKGLAYEGIWITEFDTIIRNNAKVFAAVIAILRSEPHIKLILDMNRDTGIYKMMREFFQTNEHVKFFQVSDDECPHLRMLGNDEIIEPLMKLAVGAAKTNEQLHNIESSNGEIFPADKMMKMLNGYEDWMRRMELRDERGERTIHRPLMTAIGVDPGFKDNTGIAINSIWNNHIYEEESKTFQGKDENGNGVSDTQIIQWVAEKAKYYGVKRIVIESNSGGLNWGQHWRDDYGLQVEFLNFEAPGHNRDRESVIRQTSQLLDEERFHFKNPEFRDTAVIYTVAEKSKRANQDHGDLVDANLWCNWYLINEAKNYEGNVAW